MLRTILYTMSLLFFCDGQVQKTGDLYSLVTNIKNSMPYKNTGLFVVPTQIERDSFTVVVNHILAGEYSEAATSATHIYYELIKWTDSGNGNQVYYVLKEDSSEFQTKANWKAWGTYFFKENATLSATIEVPHAYFDTHTWRIGFEAYRANNSRFFLMTGAHRYTNSLDSVSDVAHHPENMFHLVHTLVAPLSTKTIQVHAFSQSNYGFALPDVVVSNGTKFGSTDASLMEQYIDNAGFDAGVFDNDVIPDLGATHNIQGEWNRMQIPIPSFVHIEIDSFIRFNPTNRALITFAITGGMDPAAEETLPVQLQGSLEVEMIHGGFKIDAQTASEYAVSEILIQRKKTFESDETEWETIRHIESDPVYISSGRKLPSTFDYTSTFDLKSISYRIVTIEYDGTINDHINRGEKTIDIEKTVQSNSNEILIQNSPNPFKNKTTIQFVIQKYGNYSLTIYDILGRKIRELFTNKAIEPSHHKLSWDGTNNSNIRVATGIYFYQLVNLTTGTRSINKLYFSP